MPQDNLKAVDYRSQKKTVHVPCESSNATSRYETRRSSKTCPPLMEPIVEKRIILEDRRELCGNKEHGRTMENEICDSQGSSDFHLFQVSKEVQKLNEMIESWSKGRDYSGQSKNIAQDLLRGALDLQESLIMLAKLQEASTFMAGLKKKPQSKFHGDGGEDSGVDKSDWSRYTKYVKKMENPRLSADGLSGNSAQELKKVIRESLSGSSSKREHAHFQEIGSDRFRNYKHETGSDKPRISVDGCLEIRLEELKKVIKDSLSKQNLVSAYSDEEASFPGQKYLHLHSDVYASSDGKAKKSDANVQEQPKKGRSPNLIARLMGLEELPLETVETNRKEAKITKGSSQHPVCDTEMPKARNQQTVEDNRVSGRKTLKEILDSMHFKGLLKSNHSKDPQLPVDTGTRTQKMTDEMPPIVIIKPLHSSGYDREEIETDVLIRRYRSSDLKPLQTEEAGDLKSSDLKPLLTEEARDMQNLDIKPLQREEARHSKIKLKKGDSSSTGQTSVSHTSRPAKKEALKGINKAEQIQACVADGMTLLPKESTKFVHKLKSQGKTASTKPKKLEVAPVSVKNPAVIREDVNPVCSTNPISRSSINQSKKLTTKVAKPERKARLQDVNNKSELLIVDFEDIDSRNSFDSSSTTSTLRTNEAPTESTQEGRSMKEPHIENDQKTQLETVPETVDASEFESMTGLHPLKNSTTTKTSNTALRYLLLSSPSFLNCAEELFHHRNHQPIVHETDAVGNLRKSRTGLLLDCANELMERKSRQGALASHPMLQAHLRKSQEKLTFSELVAEVVDGIENLNCCSQTCEANFLADNLYLILGKDLWCKNMVVNSIWDLGWLNGLSVEEADQISCEVEENVLEQLMQEVMMDLVC